MPEPIPGITRNSNGSIKSATVTQSLSQVCEQVHARLQAFLEAQPGSERVRAVQEQSKTSLRVVEEALERYSVDELSFSYNGGKDCLVLLILYLSALHTHSLANLARGMPETLQSVYIISPHPFQEIDDFVDDSINTYQLSLARYAKPMREAFADYLSEHQSIRAIFVGTRRTDPHGAALTHFDPTDGGWPDFMRIHPVIDWHYAEIWTFIRELGVKYCSLYDMGYTSLGGTTDTHPNPALVREVPGDGGKGSAVYLPAYELVEDDAERLGRDR